MRLLSQPPETTYVIHRLYGKNRHSKLITHNSKLITEKTLHEASAYTPACMCQRFSMCKPIHTYVFAIGCEAKDLVNIHVNIQKFRQQDTYTSPTRYVRIRRKILHPTPHTYYIFRRNFVGARRVRTVAALLQPCRSCSTTS